MVLSKIIVFFWNISSLYAVFFVPFGIINSYILPEFNIQPTPTVHMPYQSRMPYSTFSRHPPTTDHCRHSHHTSAAQSVQDGVDDLLTCQS